MLLHQSRRASNSSRRLNQHGRREGWCCVRQCWLFYASS
ncbi:hypothetical protein Gotri_018261 [Gossypium trilobum]|uniref:Uncharacterized protein n=1 Tax=Gossypium trilobum TaxID=34281 RepID=A0A7J9E944_9ROSI|nr:hypothetical protein [Gossypium trilobum]